MNAINMAYHRFRVRLMTMPPWEQWMMVGLLAFGVICLVFALMVTLFVLAITPIRAG